MHLLILGGSGRTGRYIVSEALEKSHTVTALVRNPSTFPLPEHPNLRLLKGTPLSASDLDRALTTKDKDSAQPSAILVALANPAGPSSMFCPAPKPDPSNGGKRILPLSQGGRTMADAAKEVRAAMRRHRDNGPKRLVIMSAMGVGDSLPSLSWVFRFIFTRTGMTAGTADHELVDEETRADFGSGKEGMEYVLVRPSLLGGPADEDDSVEAPEINIFPDDGSGAAGFAKTARKSVARFMVDAAGAQGDRFVGRSPVITN